MVTRRSSAFTLLEVLVALVILSISVGVIMGVFSGGIRAVRSTRDYNRAVFLAQGKMEELLLKKFTEETNDSGTFEDFPGFAWEMAVTEFPLPMTAEEEEAAAAESDLTPQLRTYQITLHVTWTVGSRTRSYTLDTLRAVAPYQEQQILGDSEQ